jgi:hypothetical protein
VRDDLKWHIIQIGLERIIPPIPEGAEGVGSGLWLLRDVRPVILPPMRVLVFICATWGRKQESCVV